MPAFVIQNENGHRISFVAERITSLIPQGLTKTVLFSGNRQVAEVPTKDYGDCHALATQLTSSRQQLLQLYRRGLTNEGLVVDAKEPASWVAPSEINFISIGEKDHQGHRRVVIGTHIEDTYYTYLNAKECAKLLAEIPNLLRFEEKEAHAFTSCILYVNPRNVVEVSIDPVQINVYFNQHRNRLMISTDLTGDAAMQRFLERRDYVGTDEHTEKSIIVAQRISTAASGLIQIPASQRFCAISPTNFDFILSPSTPTEPNSSHPYTIQICRAKEGYETVLVYFKNLADRNKAADVLLNAASPAKPESKSTPSPAPKP